MDMKKTAVAFAVAGLVVAPVASKAEAEVYASIRNHVTLQASNTADSTVPDGEDTVAGQFVVGDAYSRFGLRFTEEAEDGTKYYGRYEFGTAGNVGTRLSYAGADFGTHQVTIGQQWSAWYNYANGTWGWLDGRYPLYAPTYRHNAVNWLGEFGAINVTVDLVAGEATSALFDELQVGASYDLGDFDLQFAMRIIQGVDEATANGGQNAGNNIGLGLKWAVSDGYGLQFNMHISGGTNQLNTEVQAGLDGTGAVIADTSLSYSQGYTQLGVLATLDGLMDGLWVGIGIANFSDAKSGTLGGDDVAVDGRTRITGGWSKGISENASLFAEVVLDTTPEDHISGAQGYTNLSAGWIMNF